jgi:hypothetical protein
MTLKRGLIALAVELLANNTSLVRKPDQFEIFINHICGVESDEQRMARLIEESVDQVTATVKRVKVDREFKKITSNV